MWLLLVALGLAQGLADAIPRGELSHKNPEQFMNIVSAAGKSPSQGTLSSACCQPCWGGHGMLARSKFF